MLRTLLAATVIVALPVGEASAAPPQISVSPAVPIGWIATGSLSVTATARSDGGILWMTASVEGDRSKKSAFFNCFAVRCPTAASVQHAVSVSALEEGRRNFYVAARGPDGEATGRYPFGVDRTAPLASEATLEGTSDWRAVNSFDLKWTNPTEADAAPIVAVDYALCPAHGSAECLSGRREGFDLQRIDALAVPGTGAWRVRLALVDAAGNVDREAAPVVGPLRLDVLPPTLALQADASNPARVGVRASDPDSGLAKVTVEARRAGDDSWRTLPLEHEGQLAARLDDDILAAGAYEVRAHAVDAVGNERTVATWHDGRPAVVQLPYRLGTRLIVGLRKKTGSNARPLVDYGRAVQLQGRVVDDSGAPRPGASIMVSQRLAAARAEWRPVMTVQASASGDFAYLAPPGPARTLRFEYAATPTSRSAAADVELRVRAATTVGADRLRLRNGQTVTLRGQLRGGEIPAAGKIVTLQAKSARGWITFGTARARARDGRWSYRYRFTGTTSTTRYQFRVLVPRESAYPFADGVSKRLSVVVRGG